MSEQLWSDERINQITLNEQFMPIDSIVVNAMLMQMRDEYERRIAELDARVGWVPVEDGLHAECIEISHGGEGLFIADETGESGTFLPPQFRFCERQVQP